LTAFDLLVACAALFAGAIAAVSGFGIGSILTPLLATRVDMKIAVAAVSIPHVAATAVRFFLLRHQIDRRVLWTFGISSAIGGLAGALLNAVLQGRVLSLILAALLIFAGITGLAGITIRFGRRSAVAAGAFSGLLGGLVGNQGGIRAGAMLGFDVPREAFVATATAAALVVDGARLPVYLITQGRALSSLWPLILLATIAAVAGTFIGRALLSRVSETAFRRLVSLLLLFLGISLLVT
jgi:uncharacterized membrane protein YfcA